MSIEFNCPECRQMMKAGEEFAGKKARCPSCMAVVAVPLRSTMDRVEPPGASPADEPETRAPGDSRPARRVDGDRPASGGSRPFSFDKPDAEPTRRRGPMPRWDEDEDEVRPARRPEGPEGDERERGGRREASQDSGPRTRPCPMCGEVINARARRCGFCGEPFDGDGRLRGRSPLAYGTPDARASAVVSLVLGLITLPVTFVSLFGFGPWVLCCMPWLMPILGIWQGIRATGSSLAGVAIAGIVFNAGSILIALVYALIRVLTV